MDFQYQYIGVLVLKNLDIDIDIDAPLSPPQGVAESVEHLLGSFVTLFIEHILVDAKLVRSV